jgi:hypothetical protein
MCAYNELRHFRYHPDSCVLAGAEWGECTPERKGYRNGSYTRDLVTSTGRIEGLLVPRDREGQFHTQMFERYGRYEPEVAEALTEMFDTRSAYPRGNRDRSDCHRWA